MKKALIVLMSAGLLLPAMGIAAQQADVKNCQDHPLFPTRMPNYRILNCKVEDFGVYEFMSIKGPKTSVEGKFTFITYATPENGKTNRAAWPSSATTRTPSGRWAARSCRVIRRDG